MHSHTYCNGLIIVRSQHLLAIEHHIQCLVGHTLCVDSVPLWQPAHHHVRIPYCLHLQEIQSGYSPILGTITKV